MLALKTLASFSTPFFCFAKVNLHKYVIQPFAEQDKLQVLVDMAIPLQSYYMLLLSAISFASIIYFSLPWQVNHFRFARQRKKASVHTFTQDNVRCFIFSQLFAIRLYSLLFIFCCFYEQFCATFTNHLNTVNCSSSLCKFLPRLMMFCAQPTKFPRKIVHEITKCVREQMALLV